MRRPLIHTTRVARLVALYALFPLCVPAQENALRIQFDQNPARNTIVGVFQRQGTLYVSLTDLAQVLSLTAFENKTTQKLEVKHASYTVKVSGGNPFIVVTDQEKRQTVHQMPSDIIFAANSFFVPLTSFMPFLEYLLGTGVSFDRGENVLHIGIPVAAKGFDIPSLRLEPKTNGMLIRVSARKQLTDFESWMRQDGWLYVTIADARADIGAINALNPVGLVKEIVAIQSPTSVQLTFRLAGKIAASEIIHDNASKDILISIRAQAPDESIVPERKPRTVQPNLESQRKRWELDVIVIDPGHGGHDPGTTGVTGVKEKEITLGVALKVGRLIKKNLKNTQVVYTRTDDSFVELDRRGQIANEAGGKLFISIHANAMPRKPNPSRGFEVYLLRPGRTEEAIAIAERENAVIKLEAGYEQRYKELTDENFILVTMAQSAHVKASEVFADLAQQEMERTSGIPNRGVKQAGFLVLVGAAMPNVLIETAYLSNREDERFLKSESGQTKIAESLFRAVKRYKESYEKLLQEGKDLGQN